MTETHAEHSPMVVPPKGRLNRTYWLAILLPSAAILLAVAIIEITLNYREHVAQLKKVQQLRAREAGVSIGDYLVNIEKALMVLQRAPFVKGYLSDAKYHDDMRRLLADFPAIAEVRLLDAAGTELLFVSRTEVDRLRSGLDFSRDERFRAVSGKRVNYGAAYFRNGYEPYVPVAVSANDPAAQVIIAEVNMQFVSDLVGRLSAGQDFSIYVVDQSNHLLAHPNFNLVLQRKLVGDFPQIREARNAIPAATAPRNAVESPGAKELAPGLLNLPSSWGIAIERGDEVLSSAVQLQGPQWLIFVEEPASHALKEVFGAVYRSIGILLLSVLLSFVVARALARRMSGPIVKLTKGAESLGAGELSTRITIKTNDEVESLANEFNKMAAQLEDYTGSLEQKVAQKTAQLEAANRHKSEFLANMSHELRTPLNAVIGFSDVLKERYFGPLNDKQAEYVKDINESGQHLLSLINDILDLSKIEAGHMELELSRFNLPLAIENAMVLVRERALRQGLQLKAEIAPEIVEIVGDERKFKQILINLLTNAVKFSHLRGWVLVEARRGTNAVMITVKDSGPGIALEDQATIFEEFRQLKTSGAKNEGTGLGLSLARRFTELHGGRIWVDSELGHGAAFTFTLPDQTLPAQHNS